MGSKRTPFTTPGPASTRRFGLVSRTRTTEQPLEPKFPDVLLSTGHEGAGLSDLFSFQHFRPSACLNIFLSTQTWLGVNRSETFWACFFWLQAYVDTDRPQTPFPAIAPHESRCTVASSVEVYSVVLILSPTILKYLKLHSFLFT
jgi:hypothetical protein